MPKSRTATCGKNKLPTSTQISANVFWDFPPELCYGQSCLTNIQTVLPSSVVYLLSFPEQLSASLILCFWLMSTNILYNRCFTKITPLTHLQVIQNGCQANSSSSLLVIWFGLVSQHGFYSVCHSYNDFITVVLFTCLDKNKERIALLFNFSLLKLKLNQVGLCKGLLSLK